MCTLQERTYSEVLCGVAVLDMGGKKSKQRKRRRRRRRQDTFVDKLLLNKCKCYKVELFREEQSEAMPRCQHYRSRRALLYSSPQHTHPYHRQHNTQCRSIA